MANMAEVAKGRRPGASADGGAERKMDDVIRQVMPVVQKVLRNRVPSYFERQDLQQELFLKLIERGVDRIHPERLQHYVSVMARNLIVDYRKLQAKRRRYLINESEIGKENFWTWAERHGGVVHQEFRQYDRIWDVLNCVTAEHKEVIMLLAEECSYSDIAARTGTAIGTVRSRVHWARARLRPIMARYLETGVVEPALVDPARPSPPGVRTKIIG